MVYRYDHVAVEIDREATERANAMGCDVTMLKLPPARELEVARGTIARQERELARLRLTDAEREAVEWAIAVADSLAECSGAGTGGEPSREAATLRGLLARAAKEER
jgi:hypothetical protein